MFYVLATLLAALASAAVCSDVLYEQQVVVRSASVLLEMTTSDRMTCAVHCHRRLACTHWTYAVSGGRCLLYPTLSSATAVTTGTVYASRWTPDGYQRMFNTHKAFRLHIEQTIDDSRDIQVACLQDHPAAAPAFPDDDQQVDYIRTAITAAGGARFWIGITEWNNDGEYGNFALNRTVTLKDEWLTATERETDWHYTCVWMEEEGIETGSCLATQGYVCQYEIY